MNFWDSSAIVALLVGEATAPIARRIHEADGQVIVWWGTVVECAAAVARHEREGTLRSNQASDFLAYLDQMATFWHEMLPSQRIRAIARRVLRTHPLRAADSFQLAAAIASADENPEAIGFVSFDARLNAAATREGFPILTEVATGPEAPRDSS